MVGRSGQTGGAAARDYCGLPISRRTWLATMAAACAGPTTAAWCQSPKKEKTPLTAADREADATVRDKAKKVGLEAFNTRSTDHFLGVGNGAADYCMQALDLSERIGRDFLAHFRKRGFKLDFPSRRMAVVTLKDAASYAAFSGGKLDELDGGHYEKDANLLVIFDFRQSPANGNAKRTNTFTLVHENIHLLCFNTGLLSRQVDEPAAISEGLATYGELWTRARASSAFGAVNGPRLLALQQELGSGVPWIPMDRFLADDDVFNKPGTAQIAYAEAWVLVHYLMETDERLPKFRAYLANLPNVDGNPTMSREKYAESRLGSLRELDQAVRRHALRVGRKAGVRLPAGLSRGPG